MLAPLTVTPLRKTAVDFTSSFMTVHLTAILPIDVDIQTIEELANQTDIPFGMVREGSTMVYIYYIIHCKML